MINQMTGVLCSSPIAFKSIYSKPNDKYSPQQYAVKLNILNKLRKQYKNNLTYEDYYQNKGKSFYIECASNDSLALSLLSNATKTADGIDNGGLQYSEKKSIGKYNMKHPFKTNDIAKASLLSNRMLDFMEFITVSAFCLGVLVFGLNTSPKKIMNQVAEKEVGKTMDSIENNIKSFANEKMQLLQK